MSLLLLARCICEMTIIATIKFKTLIQYLSK